MFHSFMVLAVIIGLLALVLFIFMSAIFKGPGRR
jgi:hypothetical protein